MRRSFSLAVLSSVGVLVGGCTYDPVLEREVSIRQLVTTKDTSAPIFEVDTTALPKGWIERNSTEETRCGEVARIEVASGHRVKILVVPKE